MLVSLLQPAPETFELFEDVLIISAGRWAVPVQCTCSTIAVPNQYMDVCRPCWAQADLLRYSC